MKIICSAWDKELENLPSQFKNKNYLSVPLGIGFLEAARNLQKIIDKHKGNEELGTIDEIVFLGTAGSYRKNLEIGDIVQVERSRILLLGSIDQKAYCPKKNDDYILRVVNNSPIKKVEAFSSMEITNDDVTAAKIYKYASKEFLVENMELYGVAHVANKNEISCSSILGITNYNNLFANKEWENNHEAVSAKICKTLLQFML